MNIKPILGIIVMGFLSMATPSWAQDTSTRVFNVYTHSVLEPEVFDHYVGQFNWDGEFEIRNCLANLNAAYGPIARDALERCRYQPPHLQAQCMHSRPVEAFVSDWAGSMMLKLEGMRWCDTYFGQVACSGKRQMPTGLWESTTRSAFPIWRQYLTCH